MLDNIVILNYPPIHNSLCPSTKLFDESLIIPACYSLTSIYFMLERSVETSNKTTKSWLIIVVRAIVRASLCIKTKQ